jgi:hypothetical protein
VLVVAANGSGYAAFLSPADTTTFRDHYLVLKLDPATELANTTNSRDQPILAPPIHIPGHAYLMPHLEIRVPVNAGPALLKPLLARSLAQPSGALFNPHSLS